MSKERIIPPSIASFSPDSPKDVTLRVNLSDTLSGKPMEIQVPPTIFERMTEVLKEKGIRPEFVAGAVIFVAAGVTAGIVVEKAIMEHRKRQEQETPPLVLSEAQRDEYDQMYQDYRPAIYAYILRKNEGNRQDAEDLTQDVFKRALEHFPPKYTYPDLPKPYAPWLYRIAHNLVGNRYRDRERAEKREAGPIEDETFPRPKAVSDIGSVIVSREENEELQRAVTSLGGTYLLVIWLKVQDWSNAEIAYVLGKTKGAVKSIYTRALRKLREILEPFRDDP